MNEKRTVMLPSRAEIGLPGEWDNLRDGEHARLISLACEVAEATYEATLATSTFQNSTQENLDELSKIYKRRTDALDRFIEAREAIEAER